jgi:hypothetical protein
MQQKKKKKKKKKKKTKKKKKKKKKCQRNLPTRRQIYVTKVLQQL